MFTECPHCNFDYHLADHYHWQMYYTNEIFDFENNGTFCYLGRLKVLKKLTYLFMIIIIGIAITSYKSM